MGQAIEKQQNPLGYEPVQKLLAQFALPAVISMLVSAVYNIVDQIFIGQGVGFLGNAATTVSFPIVTIMLSISTLLGAGGAPMPRSSSAKNARRRPRGRLATSLCSFLPLASCWRRSG